MSNSLYRPKKKWSLDLSTPQSWHRRALAFSLCFLLFFTSVPTELFSGGFFVGATESSQSFAAGPAGLNQAQATEGCSECATESQVDCAACTDAVCHEGCCEIYPACSCSAPGLFW